MAAILKQIMEKCETLKICTTRKNMDDYCELVFLAEDIDQWQTVLEEFLGPALKPRGVEPSKEHEDLTQNIGGIRKGQVLYKKDCEEGALFVMLWPWEDDKSITLIMKMCI